MSNARLRHAFASEMRLETMFLPDAPFFLRAWGAVRLVGEPPGSPTPPPLVRCADKALRAFPTPRPAHGPEVGP
jgi:hypothetical protein